MVCIVMSLQENFADCAGTVQITIKKQLYPVSELFRASFSMISDQKIIDWVEKEALHMIEDYNPAIIIESQSSFEDALATARECGLETFFSEEEGFAMFSVPKKIRKNRMELQKIMQQLAGADTRIKKDDYGIMTAAANKKAAVNKK